MMNSQMPTDDFIVRFRRYRKENCSSVHIPGYAELTWVLQQIAYMVCCSIVRGIGVKLFMNHYVE